jgi:two-component system, OmpR family, alkaline phosphatase synthesis response regulator PhoP
MKANAQEGARETILVVEDDPSIILGLQLNLSRAGYRVRIARDGVEGLKAMAAERPDLLLLDLMLPGVDGLEILRRIRADDERLPVVILTALTAEQDKIKGLDLGANDYVTKPFSVAELLARVRAALRSAKAGPSEDDSNAVLRAGAIELHPATRRVEVEGVEIELNSREFDVLLFLMERPERVLTRAQILTNVWGADYDGTDRTVDNFVSALRRKLGEDAERPRHVRTVWGIGYRFVP